MVDLKISDQKGRTGRMQEIVVNWFNSAKGIGEGVTKRGETVFLHHSKIQCPEMYADLKAGQIVRCDLEKGPDGLHAARIEVSPAEATSKESPRTTRRPLPAVNTAKPGNRT